MRSLTKTEKEMKAGTQVKSPKTISTSIPSLSALSAEQKRKRLKAAGINPVYLASIGPLPTKLGNKFNRPKLKEG